MVVASFNDGRITSDAGALLLRAAVSTIASLASCRARMSCAQPEPGAQRDGAGKGGAIKAITERVSGHYLQGNRSERNANSARVNRMRGARASPEPRQQIGSLFARASCRARETERLRIASFAQFEADRPLRETLTENDFRRLLGSAQIRQFPSCVGA